MVVIDPIADDLAAVCPGEYGRQNRHWSGEPNKHLQGVGADFDRRHAGNAFHQEWRG